MLAEVTLAKLRGLVYTQSLRPVISVLPSPLQLLKPMQLEPVRATVVLTSHCASLSGLLSVQFEGRFALLSNPSTSGNNAPLVLTLKFPVVWSLVEFPSVALFGFCVNAVNVCAPDVAVICASVTFTEFPDASDPLQLKVWFALLSM